MSPRRLSAGHISEFLAGDVFPGVLNSRFRTRWRVLEAALGLSLAMLSPASAQQRGVINDPDGFVNLRAGKSAEAAVVATVKPSEPFSFECEQGADWCEVTLPSGATGWMHHSRIRLHFTTKDLPSKGDVGGDSELAAYGRAHGLNYYRTLQGAVRGDPQARKTFFAIAESVDGGAAEGHYAFLAAVFHLVGDDAFSQFLRGQPLAYQMTVRRSLTNGYVTTPFDDVAYLRRHFPKTAKLLFRGEIVAWQSPDGRYAIRKVFSDSFEIAASKVTRAELIERETGKILRDLTSDDIGTGADREGSVLWSPDSKRFAYLSCNLTTGPGNLFGKPPRPPEKKQTTVYQRSGDGFVKIDLPLHDPPGSENDAELKDAVVGHVFIEPLRWTRANVLLLERHDYLENLTGPFGSIHGFDRLYEITATIQEDGSAAMKWKLRKDR